MTLYCITSSDTKKKTGEMSNYHSRLELEKLVSTAVQLDCWPSLI